MSPQSLYTLLKYSGRAKRPATANSTQKLLQKAGFVKCYITDEADFCRGKIKLFLIIPAGLPGIK
ncbi:MAG: hypothetical protein V7K25_19955 [Nostoc sp.]|uniref:hypothetical protein n=1 Tax=Nostoc sp. TaxID=1180 RepID=UPI002FFAA5F2